MSIRNLDSLFDPASIAVIGASQRVGSLGATVWRNLTHGDYGGRLFAVNLKHRELDKQVRDAELGVLPIDDVTLGRLKKEKLWAKDKLTHIWEHRA